MHSRGLVFFFWFLLGGAGNDDFIGPGLGGMGYNHRSDKKIVSNCKFIRDRFQIGIFKNKRFTRCNVLKCPYGF